MSIKEISNSVEDIEALQAIAKQTFTETFGSQNTAEDLAKFLMSAYRSCLCCVPSPEQKRM